MKKMISVRLEESDIVRLNLVAKPYGGVGKWIKAMLAGPVYELGKDFPATEVAQYIPPSTGPTCEIPVPVGMSFNAPITGITLPVREGVSVNGEKEAKAIAKTLSERVKKRVKKTGHHPLCTCLVCEQGKEKK
jgi:hypothetical protein